jgi:hypothetical protein
MTPLQDGISGSRKRAVPGAAKLLIAAGVLGLAASGIALCNIAGDRQFPTIVGVASSGTLTFHTNHPEQPTIEIPVLLK